MKKILILTLMFVASIATFAQTASLNIKNSTPCTVSMTMYAIAPTGDNCFDLISQAIVLGPAPASYTSADINGFNSSTGWLVETVAVSDLSTTFQWTSVHFTFSGCPSGWGCTPLGGNMGDMSMGCTSTVPSWSGGCVGYPITGAWSPASGSALSDVDIDLNY